MAKDATGGAVATRLTEADELLFRQVHPQFFDDDEPTNQAFRPTKKDAGKLSVSRSSETSAQASLERHRNQLNLEAIGTWAVTVGEVEDVGLAAFDDSEVDGIDDPAHGYIDFSGRSNTEIKKASALLRAHAVERGCLAGKHAERA